MGRPYSNDLRERAAAAVLRGGVSRHRAAAQFGVGVSTVVNWVRRFHETGSVAPGQMGGRKPKAIRDGRAAFLSGRIRQGAFTACAGWWGSSPSAGSRSTIARGGISSTRRSSVSKKSVVAGERERPDVARRRAQWRKRQDQIEPGRLVFIDETPAFAGAGSGRKPIWRRFAAGRREAKGSWPAFPTAIGKLRPLSRRFAAAGLKRLGCSMAPINGEAFKTYVETGLAPTLKPGDLVHHGQSRQSQRRRHPPGDSGGPRQALLPAQIFSRPEPNRAGLRQAQASLAQSRGPNHRNPDRRSRRTARRLHRRRMRKLLHQCRIPSLISSGSSSAFARR